MKSTLIARICSMGVLAALAAPVQLTAQEQNPAPAHYSVTDLGTLGGTFGVAYGINSAGKVGGGATLANGDQHSFLWTQSGGMRDLGTLGGPNSAAGGPNSLTQLAILSDTPTADPYGENFCGFGTGLICLGAVWQDGVMTSLPTLGGNNGAAIGINNRGQSMGYAENNTQDATCQAPQALDYEAVIWGPRPDQVQELPPLPGDTVGFALGINDEGQVVGSSGTCANTPLVPQPVGPHAVLWDHGYPINLGSLGGQLVSTGAAINNRGEVVGASDVTGDQALHSFLWTRENGMQDLGTLPGDVNSLPGATGGINNRQQVVGWSCNSGGNCRAYLWQNNVMTDLNALIPPTSPLYLMIAYAINDAGVIVGQAVEKSTGDIHAFLATPLRHQGNGTNAAWNDAETAPSSVTLPDTTREELRQELNNRFPACGTLPLRNIKAPAECFPNNPCSCHIRP
jgi:probable HAF family extracellular repeat protein